SGTGDGRLEKVKNHPVLNRFKERNWQMLEVFLNVAREIGKSPAQVALNWVATQPGVTSTIIGATRVDQLNENLASLDFMIPPQLRQRLDEASAPELVHPYVFFGTTMQDMINGGVKIERWNSAAV